MEPVAPKPRWITGHSREEDLVRDIAKLKRNIAVTEKGHGKVPAKWRNQLEKLDMELYTLRKK